MKLAQSTIVVLAILLAGWLGPGPAHAATAAAAKTTAARSVPKASELGDVNSATVEELKTLPGIGDAYAAKIVKNRPYANKTQLSSKGVIPIAAYAKIRALIIAKQ